MCSIFAASAHLEKESVNVLIYLFPLYRCFKAGPSQDIVPRAHEYLYNTGGVPDFMRGSPKS